MPKKQEYAGPSARARKIAGSRYILGHTSGDLPGHRWVTRDRGDGRFITMRVPVSTADRLSVLGRDEASRLVTEAVTSYTPPSTRRTLTDYQGPWAATPAVMKVLKVTSRQALQKKRNALHLLGVQFGDRKYYYPSRQFVDGGVVPGLHEVLVELAQGIKDPETWATWLAGPSPDGEGHAVWDELRGGHVDMVVELARQTRRQWAA